MQLTVNKTECPRCEKMFFEWDSTKQEYTGSGIVMRVTYILADPEYVRDGQIIMAIEPWRETA
ncbi:DUF3850 domain-containing protein [Cohnella sp. 56]|uniref:DUF3850 domain-containing protein n=1 Tax=Cohnella sp. 56 TaxID=3113722 RepID=UPI0030E89260